MPKPEIHYSHAFGMGFYIAEDGTLMSMPAFENGSFDIEKVVLIIVSSLLHNILGGNILQLLGNVSRMKLQFILYEIID